MSAHSIHYQEFLQGNYLPQRNERSNSQLRLILLPYVEMQ
jgi:hypothetical protein